MRWKYVALLGLPAAILVAPWVIRNWVWLGNPAAPFFNAWFPNPYYHPGMERLYADQLFHYRGLKHNWEIPLQLTMRGGLVDGTFGPVFLLFPCALFALRLKFGRRLLLAALVFAIPGYFNFGSRFLMSSMPFLALAMGMAMAEIPGALPALALFQAFLCWPFALSTYCDPWTWRLSEYPSAAALRKGPAEEFLRRRLPEYALKVPIELAVPSRQQVFTFAGQPQAYIDRDLVVSYESTLGNLVQDILWAPDQHRPVFQQHFRFLPITTRGIRVVNMASSENFWTVTELRLRSRGGDLPRSPGWRLSAKPNGWEVQLAFDNSYATRWSTWQAMSPGDRIQVNLPASETVDEVMLECDPAWEALPQVEVLLDNGRWAPITDTVETVKVEPPDGIRRAATRDVRALGFRYILVNQGDVVYKDILKYPAYWGLTEVAKVNGTHLYKID